MPPRLQLDRIQKSFGATRALKGVSLSIAPGEVHALIGENGAGKSTLMKILSGAHAPDDGSLLLDGEAYRPRDPLEARRLGVAMIYQELNLARHLTVEENIVLGHEPTRFGFIDRAKRRALAQGALAELQTDLPLDTPVGELTVAQQQLVEIARALLGHPRVLIMDEPTSSLTRVDTENLFAVIRRLKERGVSIVYISHFLEECRQVCDGYTVLRDGESVGGGRLADVSMEDIVRLMVGRDVSELYPQTPHERGEPILELRQVSAAPKPRSVSFTVHAGEIFGLFGLVGAGRTETLRVLFGLDEFEGGTAHAAGRSGLGHSPRRRLGDGVALLSENRKEEGLMLSQSIAHNLLLTRTGEFARFGFINTERERRTAEEWMQFADVRSRSAHQAVGELSGGNQQKVAFGRLLYHRARLLLLDEPTRGIDVGSKAQIYRHIGQLARNGHGVVLVSSYIPELLGVCDTIAVMCRGEVIAVRPAAEWTEHDLLVAAIGADAVAA